MDREIFVRIITVTAAAFEKVISDDTMEIYYEMLHHLAPHVLEKACREHIAKKQWFPKISEILAEAQAQRPSAIEAWQKLLAASEANVKPEMDFATRRALDFIGGWEQFGMTSYGDLRFIFKAFKEAYLEAQEKESRCDRVIGLVREHAGALPDPEAA